METALTKSNNNLPKLPIISLSTTAIALQENRFEDVVSSVGMSAKELLNRPVIAVLKRIEGMSLKMEMFLAAEIKKLCDVVNINPNLNVQQYQIPVIAAQLIESYPVETLEDFVLCFKRGGAGFYGAIYRLDAAVLNEWMKQYLDEKYTYVEAKVQEQKVQTTKDNEVNYEEFKKRAAEVFKTEKQSNFKENEYQRYKLENKYSYFKVENLEVYAKSQEHANQIVEGMIASGEIVREVNEEVK